jgi:transposase
MRSLRELVFAHPASKVILEDYLCAIDAAHERVVRCEAAMEDLLVSWQLRPAVEALMGFKGFKIVAAMITVSELGDIHRFAHPRQLMAYLGLVPTEATSSDKRRQGGITKCGNPHARWLLVECSQHYDTPPKVSKELSLRQVKLDRRAKEVSWRAQNRLHARFNRLRGRKLQRNKAMTAVARELTGFIWELLRELPCYVQNIEPTEA